MTYSKIKKIKKIKISSLLYKFGIYNKLNIFILNTYQPIKLNIYRKKLCIQKWIVAASNS